MRLGITKSGSVLRAIHEVRQKVLPELKQSGKNTAGGRYSYYTQNDLSKIDDYLTEHGFIILFSTEVSHLEARYETLTIKQGKQDRLTTYCGCTGVFRVQSIVDIDDWVEIDCYGFKVSMSGDKALGAATIAKRYGYMQLFSIPTTEADPDGEDDIRYQLSNRTQSFTSSKLLGGKNTSKKSLLGR